MVCHFYRINTSCFFIGVNNRGGFRGRGRGGVQGGGRQPVNKGEWPTPDEAYSPNRVGTPTKRQKPNTPKEKPHASNMDHVLWTLLDSHRPIKV